MSSLHIHPNDTNNKPIITNDESNDSQSNNDNEDNNHEIIFEGWLHVIHNTSNTIINTPNLWTKHWIVISIDNTHISRKVILSSYRYANVRYFYYLCK